MLIASANSPTMRTPDIDATPCAHADRRAGSSRQILRIIALVVVNPIDDANPMPVTHATTATHAIAGADRKSNTALLMRCSQHRK